MTTSTISIDDAKVGLFVTGVRRHNGHLSVKTQGQIKSESLIDSLKRKGVVELDIDWSRSAVSDNLELAQETDHSEEPDTPPTRKPVNNGDPMDAIEAAGKLYNQARDIHSDFVSKIKRGAQPAVEELSDISADIIDRVFDQPDAIGLLTQIKQKDHYLMEHSLNGSILLAMFGKHLGFDKATIDELGLAGLLMDAGMAHVPDDILSKKGTLDTQEQAIIEEHVDTAMTLFEASPMASDAILDVIQNHHERLDGSGYPRGKQGDELSVFARMAAIVDVYDALTSERPYRKAMNSTQALKSLLATTQGQLDQSLVQQFIRCIGVHPAGSLVKLSSERLAIVIQANKEDPLLPKVASFYSVRSGHHTDVKILDLRHYNDSIDVCVRPEEFNINLARFFREVLLRQR